jgi:hypothetical protein
MIINALSIGCGLTENTFEASAHSVFQSAANFRLPKTGNLLTLVCSDQSDLPQGIRLDTPAGFSFTGLEVGATLTCNPGFLHIESIDLSIDLRQAQIWKCDLPALNVDLTNPTVESAWRSVWQVLNERQLRAETEIIADKLFWPEEMQPPGVSRQAGMAMQSLVQATHQNDQPCAAAALRALIGLGSGLTPSGDDLIAGYLTGLWCTLRKQPEHTRFIVSLGRRVIRLSNRTNEISRAYLYHAAQGQVSSRLAALAKSISDGETGENLLNIAENAMQLGHSSGMDTVTGLLLGLAV